ncbi:threonine-phosphate decarboxylase [Jannaschia sp. M317]|uniref:threonine-phosphate decarboxylase n=1 Tax=Jannaschia sp. M317 TaxID=2867011 RepID=UPI0021A3C6C1|nr:threonine-phosphate decarboxylase [Jannaschia sp. M317]UWQ18886.1 pyridoxal phosphate-dependent class II aminotransferase [Jannaschia sp. M317]
MAGGRDHGGGVAAAQVRWGGTDWIDLSTGINPVPYPLPTFAPEDWTALPDRPAQDALIAAARACWSIPDGAAVLAAPGTSALIARLPALVPPGPVSIPGPTYNEHAAAFRAHGHTPTEGTAPVQVRVHPNNPDGRLWPTPEPGPLTIIDESFCDLCPGASHIALTTRPGTVVLKSFGKFWGHAGLRLGFAIGTADTLAPLVDWIGPWAVSGPALRLGARALADRDWASATRARLTRDAARLDRLMAPHGQVAGGTDLFRLYDVDDARALQDRLARAAIWSRTFPYSDRWIRLGLPPEHRWDRLKEALT